MSLLPHHDGSALYVPEQEPALGETIDVFVRVPAGAGVRQVHVRTTGDGEPRFTEAVVDRTDGGDVWWRVPVEARNPVSNYRFMLTGSRGHRWLNAAGVAPHDVPDNGDFKLVTHAPPPAWARDAVIYQIFPDRFARSAGADGRELPDWAVPCDWDTPVIGRGPETPRQFYGGDLDGVTERLDHLDRLGVNTVYLTPIFPARSNHRYDAASFDTVDPLLGGDAALARLADAVRARGWRLLGDITSNHTGDAHEWFTRAASDGSAPERELYYFDEATADYESWNGVRSLPKLNWGSAELRRRFATADDSLLRRWLRPPYGLDGWRVDVANMTGRRGADAYTHEVAALLREVVVRTRADGLLMAEHGHDHTGDLDRDGWHGTMNYVGFTDPVWSWLRHGDQPVPNFLGTPGGVVRRDADAVLATMNAYRSLISWRSYTHSWQLLGSHDSARIRTVVGDAARQEVAAGLLATMPGTPMIYAGDELGLTGSNGEGSRTPMPWHRPESWDTSTFANYRALVALRRAEPALRHGGLRWLHADADTLVFLREAPTGAVLVLARRAAGAPIRLTGLRPAENLHGGAPALRPDADGTITLPPDGPTFQAWRLP
ncbi:glycoside hydrolase family 13 protein [Micromonospora peucetia]|uniref:Alpha-glucosidase n=1 Tax=Micromonospora peucetia TaxID=47871 RepID=A0A1C6UI26_9ACTN|nr:glycoside hydrolase family 13 protein [Micromonospora peucetia]MCX4386778.1 glycoside hydrolase family 13 protein [Micromonospora peucetia]WSA34100.1 glycoside hydrolase family 13 protein [Micromonospora peucetia]SCL53598.1 alpha-glucosidase [Micromonospora peucetia]